MIKVQSREFAGLDDALKYCETLEESERIIDFDGMTVYGQTEIAVDGVRLKNGVIENDFGAYEMMDDGFKRGTFRSYTLYISADRVTLENMEIRNTSGYHNGQAIALMVDGDEFTAERCIISSYQDTLFIAPLPEYEYEARGFVGPLENKSREFRHARFINCLIEGSVDFIFGGGFGYFTECEFRSRNIHSEINGYVFAPSTPADQPYGFVADRCKFTAEEGLDDSVYLARPWRDYAKCLMADCTVGPHIKPEGYSDWNKPHARITSEFKEFGSLCAGSCSRADWIKEVTDEDIKYIHILRRNNL
ncbi:MAG: hypothetical protein IIZ48_06680 [Erysipelotrichales bacterium]|nr:hypothetical protein [Erysipelotrichales bacterium]